MLKSKPITGDESQPPSYLWIEIIISMIVGVAVGLALSPKGFGMVSQTTADTMGVWLALPGYIFLGLIKMVVVPLISSSIMLGIAAEDNKSFLKKAGMIIAPYFVGTTVVAITIGILLATTIEPGKYIDSELIARASSMSGDYAVQKALEPVVETTIPQKIIEMIPANPNKAFVEKSMFQIVVFSILLGVALVYIPANKSKAMLDFLESLQEISMQIVSWAMLLAPVAVFGLLAQVSITIGFDAILGMSVYVGAVLGGLLCLMCFYLMIVTFVAKRNPLEFLKHIREVQLLAFSTSSSAAVMPLSMKTAEEKLKVSPSVSQFIVPIGATINMDGTALYQVTAAVFLTQVFGIDLTLNELILLALTTVGASIGTPSTPGVGIVILATILHTIGVPPSGIALIIGVDRILDMARTTINVTGDLTACTVMDLWLCDDEDSCDKDE